MLNNIKSLLLVLMASCKSASNPVKIKNWSHKFDGIRVGRIRMQWCNFFPIPFMTPVLTRLLELQAEVGWAI